jgi:tRNA G37 N-methylase TrmD
VRFDIITIHPDLLSEPFGHSILKRAQEKGLMERSNLFEHRTILHEIATKFPERNFSQ